MAKRIPQEFIQNLLARTDIVETINAVVPLNKKGANYTACCPFHEEKTPSFSVSPTKQFYHCFGCGVSGNAIGFLINYLRMDFVEAVEKLAQQAGVQVQYEGATTGGDSTIHKKLIQVLTTAANFYQEKLAANLSGIQYLQQRGIDEKTIAKFNIGYAPPGYDSMKSLFGKDYDEKLLLNAGLLKQNNNRCYARFRNRLIFPIQNPRGQIIAFGGRVLNDDDQPKYLNSPETAVFQKRRVLYGVHELRHIRKLKHIFVVEGYMDVVALAQHGIENSVATLGTAITSEHAQQLFRLCNELIFCFDGDTAGYKAAGAALKQVLPAFKDGRDIKFMLLPQGEDPDSLVQKKGAEEFAELARKALPLSDFLYQDLIQDLDLTHPEGRASFSARARPILAEIPHSAFYDLLLKDLAERSGLEVQHLKSTQQTTTPYKRRSPPLQQQSKRLYSAIRVSAALLTGNPTLVGKALSGEKIRQLNQKGSSLLADLVDQIKANQVQTTAVLLELYRGHKNEPIINNLAIWTPPPEGNTEFEQCMEHLQKLLNKQREEQLIEKANVDILDTHEKNELQQLQRC